MGNAIWPTATPMSGLERWLLDQIAAAENEWDRLGRESAQVQTALIFLRALGLWFNTEPAIVGKGVQGFTNKKTTGAYTAWNAHEWEVRR